MGAERVVRWGPPALSQVVIDQLRRHGLGSTDAAACARELAAAVGPAARASSFVDLGACRFLEGDISGALAAWQQALISGQTAPASRALFNLGLLHEHLGLYEEAVQRFEAAEAHGIAPYAALATLGRARAQHRAGDNDRSVATLARHADRLMEDDPGSPVLAETLLGLGDVAEQAGQLDRAEDAYRAAMAAGDETVREQASLSLVAVLRFIGHDDEAQQIVEDAGLAIADPVVALDRIELLVRLGRFDEAHAVLDGLNIENLAVADRFRLSATQIDLGRVNDAIDVLEELGAQGASETRARAAYRLGEVYLAHDMAEPAATMFGTVRGLQPGYWADKASLILGDLAMAEGRHRIAAAHWADAAASRVESVSTSARDRLVDAVVAPPVLSEPAELPLVVASAIAVPEPMSGPQGEDDNGPATEAVDMVAVLDDDAPTSDPAHDEPVSVEANPVEANPVGSSAAESFDTPGEITPVAGVLMAIPVADAVDVVVPGEPIAPEPAASAASALPSPPLSTADQAPAARERVAPPTPTVIPLRRRSAASTDVAKPADAEVSPGETPNDEPVADALVLDEPVLDAPVLDVPHPPMAAPTGRSDATDAPDGPVAIKLGSGRAKPAPEPMIDLRETETESLNPYADLAPEALDGDPAPSPRNPYAELAPNFATDPLAATAREANDEPGPSTFSRFA